MNLADHLWQSTAFAALAGLLALALRRKRARVRHAIWLAASLKFLAPFSILIVLGANLAWRPAPAAVSIAMENAAQPFSSGIIAAPHRQAAFPLASVLTGIWAAGFLGIAWAWGVRWRRLAHKVRAAQPIDLGAPIRTLACAGLTEPGVFGIFRPVLLLPEGIDGRLTPAQLSAVVAHELEHVRARDNLAAAVHMSIETVFWFHPLVWWIGRRMVEERERACDEAVVGAGSDARVYAEAILNVCKFYTESPLECVSGVAGANLKRRIEGIMTKRIAGDLHIAQKIGLALVSAAALAVPVLIGMIHAPLAVAQSAQAAQAATPAPRPAPPAAPAAIPTFDNPSMTRIYRQYGPPDQKSATGTSDLWRYNSLADFKGSYVEFEFPVGKGKTGMRINWPPPLATFTGEFRVNASATALANALAREKQVPAGDPAAGFPGGHATVMIYPGKMNVMLLIPMDTLSGGVDAIGQIKEQLSSGEKGPTAANFRDYLDSPSGNYQTSFTLNPGSYVCQVLVREASSGRIYTEEIAFQVQ